MPARRSFNPWFALVGVLGVVFTVTSCAYVAMSFRALRSSEAYAGGEQDRGLMRLLRERGGVVLGVEVGLLAAASFVAMASDRGSSTRAAEEGAKRPDRPTPVETAHSTERTS